MRKPAAYGLEYVRCHGGLFLVGLKGPRGGIRSFALTQTDMTRLVDAYSRNRGPSPHSEWAAAARPTTRQETEQTEVGVPAVQVIARIPRHFDRGGRGLVGTQAGRSIVK